MDRITLKNYRCFGSEEQSARLAPLTLLVGPNSTGKTSFLALIRALWDVAFRDVVPNFREEPYDMGSWDDIVYDPGGRNERSTDFVAGLLYRRVDPQDHWMQFGTTFSNRNTAPFPIVRRFEDTRMAIGYFPEIDDEGAFERAKYSLGGREWQDCGFAFMNDTLAPFSLITGSTSSWSGINMLSPDDSNSIHDFLSRIIRWRAPSRRPYSGSPVRSRPRRTYDPVLVTQDGEGDYIPSYLANLARRNADEWQLLKGGLEKFGAIAELFNEIQVRSFGNSAGDPFQIQVRKHSGSKSRPRKGPWRNLIDVGYGVSQALPVLTELLRADSPTLFLLQQPEVHLHPQAQAALGTLFCQVAAGGRQLIIETHSDYIIDRVRMDVRDGTTGLNPEDVSILYFEPGDLAVKIHSIRIDKAGNVLDAPQSYGDFFMEEVNRSIGLRKG